MYWKTVGRPSAVGVAKNHVGNQLFETRILFRPDLAAGRGRLLGPQQFVEILIDLAAKPLKMPQPVKKLGRNHQYTFDLILGHDSILAGIGNSGFGVCCLRVYPNSQRVSITTSMTSTLCHSRWPPAIVHFIVALQLHHERHLPGFRSAARGLHGGIWKFVDRDALVRSIGQPVVLVRSGAGRFAGAGAFVSILLAGVARIVPGGGRIKAVVGFVAWPGRRDDGFVER